jgi:hypothetical protein
MQAEQPHIELNGQAAAEADTSTRPEHLVFTLGSKHIKTLDIRIGCGRRSLLTSFQGP